jgi:hypothetical protein
MARSTYIYLALGRQGEVEAAFTVKHELVTWLEHSQGDYELWRIPDGGHGEPSRLELQHHTEGRCGIVPRGPEPL